jgi:glycolate oxidase
MTPHSVFQISHQTSVSDAYCQDYSAVSGVRPRYVFFPKRLTDVQDIIQWANETGHGMVCRGAGSGTTGGALATGHHQIIIDVTPMNQILDLDTDNATITVQPGVVLADIHSAVEDVGLFYPPDPASLNQCTIGGNIAENAGGPRALKYGVTRDYVIGLKGVWANGEPFSYGGKFKKNVAGLDFIGLLTGSEGTLAVITEITLKLRPKPRHVIEALASYSDATAALHDLTRSLAAGVAPSTAEFMTRACVAASLDYTGSVPQFNLANAYVIWQVDGFTLADVNAQMARIKALSKAPSFWVLATPAESDHVWSVRRNVSLGLKKMAGKKYSEDIVVPVACVPDAIRDLDALSHPCGIQVLGYGHLGDGNIHVNILKMTATDTDWAKYAPAIIDQVMDLAMAYGGSLSGEHGIGLTKKSFLPRMFSAHDIQLMKQIKGLVDPDDRMNPHKLFPK